MTNNTNLKNLNALSFEKEVLRSDKPVLVEFVTEWSGACHILGPVIKEVLSYFKDKMKFYKVDIESSDSIAKIYGIQDVPTLLFFKKGILEDHLTGAVSKKVLAGKLKRLVQNTEAISQINGREG